MENENQNQARNVLGGIFTVTMIALTVYYLAPTIITGITSVVVRSVEGVETVIHHGKTKYTTEYTSYDYETEETKTRTVTSWE